MEPPRIQPASPGKSAPRSPLRPAKFERAPIFSTMARIPEQLPVAEEEKGPTAVSQGPSAINM
jgi:hypothetical protein